MLDDDIVHPTKKLEDTCKELVPGSSPGRGAERKTPARVLFRIWLREGSAGGTSVQDSKGLPGILPMLAVKYRQPILVM